MSRRDDIAARDRRLSFSHGCAFFLGFGLVVDGRFAQHARQTQVPEVRQRFPRGRIVELVDQVVEIVFDGHVILSVSA